MKITEPFSILTQKMSYVKSRILQKLGLMCVIPKLTRPFEPIFEYARCKLGINQDNFMETPPCNATACIDPSVEEREITRDMGLPNLDFMVDGMVSTLDECFNDMPKVKYGSRVLVKIVDDESCDDSRYESMCQEMMDQNRIVLEDDCQTPR